MAGRGGKRAGSGRKPMGAEAPIQIPMRIRPKLKQRIEELSRQNGLSQTKQIERWLELVSKRPELVNENDLSGWRGPHQRAIGLIIAHGLGRIEAALGLDFLRGDRWSTDRIAGYAALGFLSGLVEELKDRWEIQFHPLSPDDTAHAYSVGANALRSTVSELDAASETRQLADLIQGPKKQAAFDDPTIDGNRERILAGAARDLPWLSKQQAKNLVSVEPSRNRGGIDIDGALALGEAITPTGSVATAELRRLELNREWLAIFSDKHHPAHEAHKMEWEELTEIAAAGRELKEEPRHPDGRWFTLDEARLWARQRIAERHKVERREGLRPRRAAKVPR